MDDVREYKEQRKHLVLSCVIRTVRLLKSVLTSVPSQKRLSTYMKKPPPLFAQGLLEASFSVPQPKAAQRPTHPILPSYPHAGPKYTPTQ